MRNKLLFTCLLGLIGNILFAQNSDVTSLFKDEKPFDIKLKFSIKDIKKNTNDSVFMPSMLYYKNETGKYDSIKISIRVRGDYRLKTCYFPPLRIKIEKAASKGTPFEGNKSLKLVIPCQTAENKNYLLYKEYLCYQMYEAITPYYFNTRLVNIEFVETGKKEKNFQLAGFFIEDDDLVADRHKGKIGEGMKIHPMMLQDTSALRYEIYQYMVANTDWSTTFQHNTKLLIKEPKKYIPLAYDFDLAGFVNPPYAVVDETLGIEKVTDRLFRGFCRSPQITQAVRAEFLSKESVILAVVDQHSSLFEPKQLEPMKKYLQEFFQTLKDDNRFKKNITDNCRTK
ncbi:MAG: hypothetical protein AABY93_15140 [Bacteroidota bacterium]